MKFRKLQRVALARELASLDGRRKATKKLRRMWSLVNAQAGHSFDVAFAMLSSLMQEVNEYGARLDSQAAAVAAECGGFVKADNEGWHERDGFIVAFADDLVAC